MSQGYAAAWLAEEDLDSLNRRLHDNAPPERLASRGQDYVRAMFDDMYPEARPGPDSTVAEFGPGVGWVAQAVLERFSPREIVGIDISESIAAQARRRLPDPRVRFTTYDGRTLPFPDSTFDVIYSCAAIQHIEKHAAFLQMKELHRVLKPGGHAVLHLMSVHYIPHEERTYEEEARIHVENRPEYWLHYYAFDELFVWFHDLLQVDDLDIKATPDCYTWFVHFSKGTGRRLRDPQLAARTFPAQGAPAPAPRLRDIGREAGRWAKRKVARP